MEMIDGYKVYTAAELAEILKEHAEFLIDNNKGTRADLTRADLTRADLDYSSFPLWCGGANFKCSAKLMYQLLAHVYTLNPSSVKEEKEFIAIKEAILKYALKSHRAKDLKISEVKK